MIFDLTKSIAALVGVAVMAAASAHAQDGWRVVEMEGAVRTSQPMAGVQLISTGETLGAGAVVSTGLDGRVVLARGAQEIVVGPNSRMSLPAIEEQGVTRVLQDLGVLLFRIDKRETQHFRVDTPVIAAVVKGTTFTVAAGADAHAVHVAQGAVEVSAVSGEARQLVTPGMTVHVSRSEPTVIRAGAASGGRFGGVEERRNGQGDVQPARAPEDGEQRALTVPTEIGGAPIDFAEVTNGLIDGDASGTPGAAQASAGQSIAAASGNGVNKIATIRQTAAAAESARRNATASANSNAGGNGKGAANASANSNAGGNGKGAANANANSNAGGNGNGAANANVNAGGNGKSGRNADTP